MTRSNADGRDAGGAVNAADATSASRAASATKAPVVPPPLPSHVARTSGTQATAVPLVVPEAAPVTQRTSSLSAYSRVARRSSSTGMPAVAPVMQSGMVSPATPHSRPSISHEVINLAPAPSSARMPVATPSAASSTSVQNAPIVEAAKVGPPPLPPPSAVVVTPVSAPTAIAPVVPIAPVAPPPIPAAAPVAPPRVAIVAPPPIAIVAPPQPIAIVPVQSAPIATTRDTLVEAEPLASSERNASPPSIRPPAPEPFVTSGETESIAQTFDRLLGSELDSRFAEMRHDSDRPTATSDPGGMHANDLVEVRNLFEQLAANHVRQVRDFLIDLKWAEASRDWIGICEPAVRSLMRGAEKLELEDLRVALAAFGEALAAAAVDGAPTLEGTIRDRLLSAYDKLIEILPKAFALDMDRTQRESVIVQSLLLQIPEVRKVIVDKLYAAGLNSLAVLVMARADELAVATGISPRIADRIVEKFQTYRHDLSTASPDATRARERGAIETLVTELAAHHEAFEKASSSWSNEAADEKKRLRTARHKTLMQINVALARLGEVGRLDEIEKLPFARKLERLRSYLKDAQEMYVAAP